MDIEVYSIIPDHRIKAINALIELTIEEYLQIADGIIEENEYQRKKVISSRLKTTLKNDIRQKCSIPPIVLGVRDKDVPKGFNFANFDDKQFIKKAIEDKKVIILDGLQRTYVLKELSEEIQFEQDWKSSKIRCEVYLGLEKLGILYRMLTLNTGQTTMSTRHLLEILYLDYTEAKLSNNVSLLLDKNEEKIDNPMTDFIFKDVIQGYNSFLNGKEIPIERADILQNIETLNSLERKKEDLEGFRLFVDLFHHILVKFNKLDPTECTNEKLVQFEVHSNPFGKSFLKIFNKSQSLTGLGAALYFLSDRREILFADVKDLIDRIHLDDIESKYYLLSSFERIKTKSKKVGNDQRFFFKIFFTRLFDEENEVTYLNIKKSIEASIQRLDERLFE
jgi:hypothetical protein